MRRVIVALAVGLAACEGDPLVPLVQLRGAAPRQIELGDKIEIDGVGFPQGRRARVLFDGTLHRPGETADEGSEIETHGEVVAPDRIEIPVTDELLASFCGAGTSAVHTTFDGAITVIFTAQTPGAAPVAGNLQHTTIDALPTAAGQARYLADAEDGDKLARASGLRVEARTSGELVVASVEPSSRAASAALAKDDVIVSVNGVRALGVADLAPPPGTHSVPLVVRRGDAEERHDLVIDGARVETPRRFGWPAALVAGVALLLALLAASPGRSVLWMRRRLAGVRARVSGPSAFADAVGLATAGALPLLVPSADVSVLALVAFSGAIAVALLVSRSRAVVAVASRIVPSIVALAFALVVAGSLRADELVAAQGAAPWEVFAFRSPAHAALAFAFVAAGVRRQAQASLEVGDGSALPRAAERFLARLTAALAVVVFFGGWRLPLSPTHVHGAVVWLAAALFVVKTALVAAAVDRFRTALPAVRLGALVRSSLLRLAPLAAVAGIAAAVWEKHVTSRGVSAATTFALVGVACAATLQLAWPRPVERTPVDTVG